jgi:hypothetical protein
MRPFDISSSYYQGGRGTSIIDKFESGLGVNNMRIEVGTPTSSEQGWLPVESVASVHVTSQLPEQPIESIFRDDADSWSAEVPGTQLIRIVLEAPRPIRRVQLQFSEPSVERTQEFVLQWASTLEGERNKLIRQQWNFSPHGSTLETEDIRLDLASVLVFELLITPDIRHGSALAKLQRFRMQ